MELEAGPELDALVAEKIMGWTKRRRFPAEVYKWTTGYMENLPERGDWTWFDTDGKPAANAEESENCVDCGDIAESWAPSTDIAAAWQVVEKLMPLVGHLYPTCDAETGKLMHWCAVVERNEEERFGIVADTAPLAICRAALKAVE